MLTLMTTQLHAGDLTTQQLAENLKMIDNMSAIKNYDAMDVILDFKDAYKDNKNQLNIPFLNEQLAHYIAFGKLLSYDGSFIPPVEGHLVKKAEATSNERNDIFITLLTAAKANGHNDQSVSHFLKNYYKIAPEEIQGHIGMAAYYARMAEVLIQNPQITTFDLINSVDVEFLEGTFVLMKKIDKNAYFKRQDIRFYPVEIYAQQHNNIPLGLSKEQKLRTMPPILQKHQWLEGDILHHKPNVSSNVIVSYFGNVKPTSLYRQGSNFILPMAPYVHPYHPVLYSGYIHVAYDLKPTQKIKDFFGEQDIRQCYLVAQGIGGSPDNQLLRLHGFIHGKNASRINKSVNVTAKILPIKDEPHMSFSDNNVEKTSGVHCHDGVASPNNFALKGWKEGLFNGEFQAFGVYLPESHTATLIIVGHGFIVEHASELAGEPILTPKAAAYLDNLLK